MGTRKFVIRDPGEVQDRIGEAYHLTFENGLVALWLLTHPYGTPRTRPFLMMAIATGPRTVIHEIEIPDEPASKQPAKKRVAKKAAASDG
jgi:hypothetical protein